MEHIINITHPQTPIEALLQRRRDDLWHLCMRHTWGNRERARDLMQEVVLVLMHKIDRLRPNPTDNEERSWVLTVADNALIDLKRKRRIEYTTWGDREPELPDDSDREAREQIEELSNHLSPSDQQLLRLYRDGYTVKEISVVLSISADAAGVRMHRLIQRMRTIYNEIHKTE